MFADVDGNSGRKVIKGGQQIVVAKIGSHIEDTKYNHAARSCFLTVS